MMWNLDQKLVPMFLKLVVIETVKVGVVFIFEVTIVESENKGILKDHMSHKSILKSQF